MVSFAVLPFAETEALLNMDNLYLEKPFASAATDCVEVAEATSELVGSVTKRSEMRVKTTSTAKFGLRAMSAVVTLVLDALKLYVPVSGKMVRVRNPIGTRPETTEPAARVMFTF